MSYFTPMLSYDEVISNCRKQHGDRYEYLNEISFGSKTILKIKCPLHGLFELRAEYHYSGGTGCPQCSKEYTSLGKFANKFIPLANGKHLNKYNYDKVKLDGYKKKIMVTCNKCKEDFEVLPIDHLHGVGCINCAN